MMDAKQHVEEALKQLEKEIVFLENAQTELLRRKWALEEELEKQKEAVSLLELRTEKAEEGLSMWKKAAIVMGVAWGIVLSLFNIERK